MGEWHSLNDLCFGSFWIFPMGLLQCRVILSSLQEIKFIRLCMICLSLLQDVDVTWISHIIVLLDQPCDFERITIRYLPQIFWQLGAVAPLCFVFVLCLLWPHSFCLIIFISVVFARFAGEFHCSSISRLLEGQTFKKKTCDIGGAILVARDDVFSY